MKILSQYTTLRKQRGYELMKNIMSDEDILLLIQTNMENYWLKLSETGLFLMHNADTAMYYAYTETNNCNTVRANFPGDMVEVLRFHPLEANLDAEIRKMTNFYDSKQQPFSWWTASDVPWNSVAPNILEKRLIAHGFSATEEVAGMAMNISSKTWSDYCPEGIEIVEACSPQQFSDWIEPVKIAFEMSTEGAELYKKTIEKSKKISNEIFCYVAYHEKRPVASCALFLDSEGAYCCNGSTLPEFRQRGITSAITLYSLEVAREKNYEWATCHASPYSLRLLERLGFEKYIDYTLYY